MSTQSEERELKFEFAAGAVLPDLGDLLPAGGRLHRASESLESTYFDTAEHDLLRRGMTLRHRTTDDVNGWLLKVPNGEARTEIEVPAANGAKVPAASNGAKIPYELADLVAGVGRGRQLQQIVTMRTDRQLEQLLDASGVVLVEIADDTVHSTAIGNGSARLDQWREVEAELGPAGDETVLAKVSKRLKKSDAHPAAYPNKVSRALSSDLDSSSVAHLATETAERGPEMGKHPRRSAAGILGAYTGEQDEALIAGDVQLRRGIGGIHPTRVATRRLRSTLRIFAEYYDIEQAAALDTELSWYADLLGEVRDREVQRERMRAHLAELPEGLVMGPVSARIDQHLATEQDRHQKALDRAMKSDRYFALLRQVERWVADPPLTAKASAGPKSLRRAVKAASGKVDKHLRAALHHQGGDEELHKARKAAKRARYAAELATPVIGRKQAAKSIGRHEEFQDVLGEHQDSVVAGELLLKLGAVASGRRGETGFTYGVLYARERQRAEETRTLAKKRAKRARRR